MATGSGINAPVEPNCSRCHGQAYVGRTPCARCAATGVEPKPIEMAVPCECGHGTLRAQAYPGDGRRTLTTFCAWCNATYYLTHENGEPLTVRKGAA